MALRRVMVCLLLSCIAVASYCAYYGIERDLTEKIDDWVDPEGKLVSGDNASTIKSELRLYPNRKGSSEMIGVIANQMRGYVINSISMNVYIVYQAGCRKNGETVYCAPLYTSQNGDMSSREIYVHNGAYECYRGSLGPRQQSECKSMIAYDFNDNNLSWNYNVDKITGHPVDPLGIFSP